MRGCKSRLTITKYQDDTNTYYVKNKENVDLGDIGYYKDWKCWVFEPDIAIIFSADCLQEIVDFIKKL